MTAHSGAAADSQTSIVARMSWLDRFLPVWIGVAIAIGIGLGKGFPELKHDLDTIRFADVSLPVGLGLLWMMYPVLAKVRDGRHPRR